MDNQNEINKIRKIIENNYKILEKTDDTTKCKGFEFKGVYIYDPTLDETGRFSVNDARKYYGDENIEEFLKES